MMTYPNTKRRFIIHVLIALILTVGLTGCASQSATQVQRAENDKLITDIVTSADAANLFVTVKGSQRLAYTAVKQDFPLGVQFYFPGTALDNLRKATSRLRTTPSAPSARPKSPRARRRPGFLSPSSGTWPLS